MWLLLLFLLGAAPVWAEDLHTFSCSAGHPMEHSATNATWGLQGAQHAPCPL